MKRTALITGASAGIGSEFARQLAKQGYDLILIARREERLETISTALKQEYGVNCEGLIADLSQSSDIQLVIDRISQRPEVDILINNAGFGIAREFTKADPEKVDAILQVHITAAVLLTRAVVPGMISRHHGIIINVASMAGLIPLLSVLYAPTKAFLINFSRALDLELTGSGVQVQALCPGFTYTEFHDVPELKKFDRRSLPAFLWLTSEHVVRHSLRDLQRHKVISIPGLQYQLIGQLIRCRFTQSLVNAVIRQILSRRKPF